VAFTTPVEASSFEQVSSDGSQGGSDLSPCLRVTRSHLVPDAIAIRPRPKPPGLVNGGPTGLQVGHRRFGPGDFILEFADGHLACSVEEAGGATRVGGRPFRDQSRLTW
jgi:hypothetical protein